MTDSPETTGCNYCGHEWGEADASRCPECGHSDLRTVQQTPLALPGSLCNSYEALREDPGADKDENHGTER